MLVGSPVEARDAARHPTTPSPGPTTESYPAPVSVMLGLRKHALNDGGALEVGGGGGREVSEEGPC